MHYMLWTGKGLINQLVPTFEPELTVKLECIWPHLTIVLLNLIVSHIDFC